MEHTEFFSVESNENQTIISLKTDVGENSTFSFAEYFFTESGKIGFFQGELFLSILYPTARLLSFSLQKKIFTGYYSLGYDKDDKEYLDKEDMISFGTSLKFNESDKGPSVIINETDIDNNRVGEWFFKNGHCDWFMIRPYQGILSVDIQEQKIYFGLPMILSHMKPRKTIESFDLQTQEVKEIIELSQCCIYGYLNDFDRINRRFVFVSHSSIFSIDMEGNECMNINIDSYIDPYNPDKPPIKIKARDFCIITDGRILIAAKEGLFLFDKDGNFLAIYHDKKIWEVAFDWVNGAIAYINGKHNVVILAPNSWVHTSQRWSLTNLFYVSQKIKDAVLIMTMIRSLCYEHIISLLPNELLFEIFQCL